MSLSLYGRFVICYNFFILSHKITLSLLLLMLCKVTENQRESILYQFSITKKLKF